MHQLGHRRAIWSALLVAVAIVLVASAARATQVRDFESLPDPHGRSLDDARTADGWTSVAGTTANFGFTSTPYWFRFRLDNADAKPIERFVELAYPLLDRVSFHAVFADGAVRSAKAGAALPFAERQVKHRNYIFPVELPPASHIDIYVRIETDSAMQVPVRVLTQRELLDETYRSQLGFGLFYGVMAIMVLYNLFVFLSVRDPSYMWFCWFVLTFMGLQLGLDGLSFQYLWPNTPWLNDVAMPLLIALPTAFAVQFSRSFLQLSTSLPKWNRPMRTLAVLGAAVSLVSLVTPYAAGIRIATAYAAVGIVVIMIAGVMAFRRGFSSARYYLLAWGAILMTSLVVALVKFGLLPATDVIETSPKIGACIQVVLLSLALADRINALQRDARLAQREALNAQRRATESLRSEVDARTAELREQADQLRELDAQKTRFFQNVSHELRTPLTLILSSSKQLRETPTLARDDRIKLLDKNARRLLRLVNELLNFQKLAAGKKQLSRSPIDLAPFLRSCAEYVRPACDERRIEFTLSLPADGEAIVEAEADALEKVAFNYLSNALKHTPGGGRIELSLTADDDSAELAVTDTGPGIEPEQQTRLFQVFTQLERNRAAAEGSGLGLALVREIVAAHGGSVGIDSDGECGSRFWATLPRAEARPQTLATFALSRWDLDDSHEQFDDSHSMTTSVGTDLDHDHTILVVDDLPDMRGLIRRTLHRDGYGTIGASNGVRALDAAQRVRPALIVTDWMMPEMSGPELIEKVRNDQSLAGVPIVLLTAKSDEESRASGVSLGADAFLGKPFDELELSSTVRNLLQLKMRERELERAQRQKEELTRFVVHDLKNPLTIIAANVEIMLDEDVPDDVRESLVAVQMATESTHRMVLNLLDISRSEDAALEPRHDRIDIEPLLADLKQRMARWLDRKRQRLELDARVGKLEADRGLMARVLENLIENASKYGPEGEPIRIEVEGEGRAVVFRVRDLGPGVPWDQRRTVFEKYGQLDRDRGKTGSHGLGLVFCRLAAEAHGGTAGVDDNKPTGACFWVRIPRGRQRSPSWADQVQNARPSE